MKNLISFVLVFVFGLFTANVYGQEQEGQQQQQEQHQQEQTPERQIEVTDLPQPVQEKLQEDYEEWEPAEASIVTDAEQYEEGSFYKVKLNNAEEQETKIVMITSDGEVLDEQEEEFEDGQQKHRRGQERQY